MAPPTLWKQSHDYHHGHSCQYVGAEKNRLPLLSTHTDLGTFPYCPPRICGPGASSACVIALPGTR